MKNVDKELVKKMLGEVNKAYMHNKSPSGKYIKVQIGTAKKWIKV